MKHFILLFSVLLMTQVNANDGLVQDDTAMLKAKAKELTKKYTAELGMDAGKTAMFEEIVLGYMTRRSKMKQLNVADRDKQVMLKQLAIEENEDMAELLPKGQYKKYLKAKTKLQP